MKKIIAINASPRTGWNTAALVREAARGAEVKKKAFTLGVRMAGGFWEQEDRT